MKVPYAKALSSWEKHIGGSLKSLLQDVSFATQLGFTLPCRAQGPEQQLPKGWLMVQAQPMQTKNTKSIADTLQEETGENQQYIYSSPKGCRFLALKAALAHAGKQLVLNRLPQVPAPQCVSATTVEFTSNHGDYMHRGLDVLFADSPCYVYNMWVYRATKLLETNRHADHHLDILFDAGYRQGAVKIQRLSIIPRIPQIQGLFVPSPDVDPRKNALIKLLCKPLHVEPDMNAQGEAIDPYAQLYRVSSLPEKNPSTTHRCPKLSSCRDWKSTVMCRQNLQTDRRFRNTAVTPSAEWRRIWMHMLEPQQHPKQKVML